MRKFRFKLNKDWTFFLFLSLLMVAIFVRHAFEVPIPDLLFVALSVLMVLTGDRNKIMAVLVMCIPLGMVFTTIYTCFVGALSMIVRYHNRIHVNASFMPVLLMIIWELLHCLFTGFSIKPFIGMWVPYLICILLMWQDTSDIDYGIVVRCLSICTGVVCLALLGIVLKQSGYRLSSAFMNMKRLGLSSEDARADVLIINPNSLGIICTLAITGLLQLKITGQGNRLDILLVLFMVICGALTTSKTFLVLLFATVFLCWFSQKGGVLKKIRMLLLIVLTGIIMLFLLEKFFPIVIDNFIMRLTVADITSGRNELFRLYHHFILNTPKVLLFGVGVMEFAKQVVGEYAVAVNVPHNGIQEIVIAWGAPGFVMFVSYLLTMIHQSRRYQLKRYLICYIPLLLVLLKAQVGQMITSDYTMMSLIFCYLSMTQKFENE